MDLVVYDDKEQRYVPLLVALCAALLTGLVMAGFAYFLTRPSPAAPVSEVTAPQAARQEQPTCAPALQQADTALELAARMEGALREQTSVMDELLAKRVTEQEALNRALPPLMAGAKDRQAFLDAVTTYRRAREAC